MVMRTLKKPYELLLRLNIVVKRDMNYLSGIQIGREAIF